MNALNEFLVGFHGGLNAQGFFNTPIAPSRRILMPEGEKYAIIQEHLNATITMVLPNHQTDSEDEGKAAVDEDIEDIMNEAEGLEKKDEAPVVQIETPDSIESDADLSEKMERSARTVIDTCMDLRRGENILLSLIHI